MRFHTGSLAHVYAVMDSMKAAAWILPAFITRAAVTLRAGQGGSLCGLWLGRRQPWHRDSKVNVARQGWGSFHSIHLPRRRN